jgi:Tfp pilus assembly protein PilF
MTASKISRAYSYLEQKATKFADQMVEKLLKMDPKNPIRLYAYWQMLSMAGNKSIPHLGIKHPT